MSAPTGTNRPVRASRAQSEISTFDWGPKPPTVIRWPGQNPARFAVNAAAVVPNSRPGAASPR
ncbi:Uncharacterised protein [Mycobacteroides abscessus subsp. abscessus]|nr:Uncharacterised protein [Mycobacteroides abscessus subsp. abscessus]